MVENVTRGSKFLETWKPSLDDKERKLQCNLTEKQKSENKLQEMRIWK